MFACSTGWSTTWRAADLLVDFYQLGDRPAGPVLARIAERVIEGGGRLLVVDGDAAGRAAISKALWAHSPESFLAHGEGGAGDADRQPILLSAGIEARNDARAVAIADGAWREEALGFDRVFHLFGDEALDAARLAWRALADRDGVERRFWKNEDGRWTQAG